MADEPMKDARRRSSRSGGVGGDLVPFECDDVRVDEWLGASRSRSDVSCWVEVSEARPLDEVKRPRAEEVRGGRTAGEEDGKQFGSTVGVVEAIDKEREGDEAWSIDRWSIRCREIALASIVLDRCCCQRASLLPCPSPRG